MKITRCSHSTSFVVRASCRSAKDNITGLFVHLGRAGLDDRLGAVSHLEFVEDVGDVIANGFIANNQLPGNFLVVESPGNQDEHLSLTLG